MALNANDGLPTGGEERWGLAACACSMQCPCPQSGPA